MLVDHIRYDILAQEALRGLVRKVLAEVSRNGLQGDHHFNISFNTGAPGVRIPARLREQYPQEMTIVLQYQFWDLKVSNDAFEIGLSFSGVRERLVVPFEAITAFVDPSVQFALQFQAIMESEDEKAAGPIAADTTDKTDAPKTKPRRPARHERPRTAIPAVPAVPDSAAAAASATKSDGKTESPPDKPGAEVVRLDRFRKK